MILRGREWAWPILSSIALLFGSIDSSAMSMKDAVVTAVRSNPEIGEAIANREAIEFELEQGFGLRRPRVDLDASVGGEFVDNQFTRENGDSDHLFVPRQSSLVVRQLLFDGFGTQAEIEKQASRVDGASLRIKERSEFIALAVIREYLEMQRLQRMIKYANENIRYHKWILGEVSRGATAGSLSVADRQQAQERIFSAESTLTSFKEELYASQTAFLRLVGKNVGKMGPNIDIRGKLPKTLSNALSKARTVHPSVAFARADVDTYAAYVKEAESKFYPKLSLEGKGTLGDDLGGERGTSNDLAGNLVLNWNLYNGGIDTANKQEQIRHVDEAYQRLYKITREVEEGVRLSWDRRAKQQQRLRTLLYQLSSTDQLANSYLEQYKIGERSLLDLLDNQNTRFSAQIAVATADVSVRFAEYRILAAAGILLRSIGVSPPPQATVYAREKVDIPPTPAPGDFDRMEPPPREGD